MAFRVDCQSYALDCEWMLLPQSECFFEPEIDGCLSGEHHLSRSVYTIESVFDFQTETGIFLWS
jgi:hypothetical protein